jgi:hypothetical protein
MKNFTRNILAVLVVTLIASHVSFASGCSTVEAALGKCSVSSVPEIDAAMGAGALALIGGAVMVIRGRVRAKK